MKRQKGLKTYAVALALSILGAMGVFYSPWGQEARTRAARGECPFPGHGKSIASLNADAMAAHGAFASTVAAHNRGAWGLTLAESSKPVVYAWAENHHVTCRPLRGNLAECRAQQPKIISGLWQDAEGLTLTFHFDANDILHTIGSQATYRDAPQAIAAVTALVEKVVSDVGGAPQPHAPISTDTLAQGPLSQVRVEFHRSDLMADVSATTFADQVAVQHSVRSL